MCVRSGTGDDAYAGRPSQVLFMRNFLAQVSNDLGAEDTYVTCPVGLLFLLCTLFGAGGARGRTGEQIAETLQLRSSFTENNLTYAVNEVKVLFQELHEDLTSQETFIAERRVNVITSTNGLFTQKDYEIRPSFIWSVKNEFRSNTQKLDFANQSESARQINNWVNTETRGIIQRIFNSPEELPANTKVALLNVFTFKDNWQTPFSPHRTRTEEFEVSNSKTIRVPTMNSIEEISYGSMPNKGISIIRKPLQNYRFSFIVILPTTKWNTDALLSVLNGHYSIKELIQDMDTYAVSLKLPKFKIKKTTDLIGTMEAMGVSDLFRKERADLTGITSSDRLYISMLKQGVALNVDEYGVEAAAVTSAVAVPMSLIQPSVEFHVNHPFLCMIYDEHLHVPLVVAYVTVPEN